LALNEFDDQGPGAECYLRRWSDATDEELSEAAKDYPKTAARWLRQFAAEMQSPAFIAEAAIDGGRS
jgi:hypothetical protein